MKNNSRIHLAVQSVASHYKAEAFATAVAAFDRAFPFLPGWNEVIRTKSVG